MEIRPKAYRFHVPESIQWIVFWTFHSIFRFILVCCVKVRSVHGFPHKLTGNCILASSHNSHLDAHLLGTLIPRKIDWLSRIEFFRNKLSALLLYTVSAIPIHRQGVPVRAIKESIFRLKQHRNIGICPEGEVRSGEKSVIYGGSIKRGVGLLAYRASRPVVPCVVLGVQQLCRIHPWLPARRGEIWVNFGNPVYPRLDLPPKQAREELCRELESQFRELFRQIMERYSVPEAVLP